MSLIFCSLNKHNENFSILSSFIENNKNLKELNLASNPIFSHDNIDGINAFIKALEKNDQLERLNLDFTNLGFRTADFKKFSDFLKKNKSIVDINLADNYLLENSENINLLSEIIKENRGIKKIDISANCPLRCKLEDFKIFSDAFRFNSLIEELDFSCFNFGFDTQKTLMLILAIKENKSIKKILLVADFLQKNFENNKIMNDFSIIEKTKDKIVFSITK